MLIPRYAWQFLTSKPHFYLPPPGQCYKQRPQLTRINVFPEFLSLIEITFKELGLASNTIQPPPKIKQIHCRGIIYFLSIHFNSKISQIQQNESHFSSNSNPSIEGESPLKPREWSPGRKILRLMSSTAPHTVA